MLIAALVLEREPPQWAEFPAALVGWVRTAGTLAALALAIWLLAYALRHPKVQAYLVGGPQPDSTTPQPWSFQTLLVPVGAGLTASLYVVALLLSMAGGPAPAPTPPGGPAGGGGGLASIAALCF